MTQHPDIQRLRFRDRSTSYTFAAATDYSAGSGTAVVTVRGAKFKLVIQKIAVMVTTDHAATQTFQSTAAAKVLATTKASPGLGPIVFDFGPEGYELPAGESLLHKMSAAGMAGSVTITAFEKPDADQSLTPNKSVGSGDSF